MMTNAMIKLMLICVCLIANYQYAASMPRENYELYKNYGVMWPENLKINDEVIKEYPLPAPKNIRCRSRYQKYQIKQKKPILMPYEILKHIGIPTTSPYDMKETIKYIDNPEYNEPSFKILTTKFKEPNVKYQIPKYKKYPRLHDYIIKELANLPTDESGTAMKIIDTPEGKVVVAKAEGQKASTKLVLNNSSDNKDNKDNTQHTKVEDNVPVDVVYYDSDPSVYDTKGTIKYIDHPEYNEPSFKILTTKFKEPNVKYQIPKYKKYPKMDYYTIKELANLPTDESGTAVKIVDSPEGKVAVAKAEGQKVSTKLVLNNSSDNKDNKEDTKYTKIEDNMPTDVVYYDSEPPVYEIKREPSTPPKDDQHAYHAFIVGEHEDEYNPSIFTSFG